MLMVHRKEIAKIMNEAVASIQFADPPRDD
jgi:hypothetical protein